MPRRLLRYLLPESARAAVSEWRELTARQRRLYLFVPRTLRWPARVPSEPRIVFLCYGNKFRSPMAEALFRASWVRRGHRPDGISSAGLHITGAGAHPTAIAVAAEMGVALDDHRTRPVTAELVREADLFVAMDRRNVALLLDRFPEARAKLVLLGAFAGPRISWSESIRDPYGRPIDEVRACYRRIGAAVDRLASRIEQHGH